MFAFEACEVIKIRSPAVGGIDCFNYERNDESGHFGQIQINRKVNNLYQFILLNRCADEEIRRLTIVALFTNLLIFRSVNSLYLMIYLLI